MGPTFRLVLFSSFILCTLLELTISIWLLATYERDDLENTMWAIPLNLAFSLWVLLWVWLFHTRFVQWFENTSKRNIRLIVAGLILSWLAYWFTAIWTACGLESSSKWIPHRDWLKALTASAFINAFLVSIIWFIPPKWATIGARYRYKYTLARARVLSLRDALLQRAHARGARLALGLRLRAQHTRDRLPGRTFRCPICLEDAPTARAARFAPCLHPVCAECVRAYARAMLGARRFPILCPQCAAEPERPGTSVGTLESGLLKRIKISSDDKVLYDAMMMATISVQVDCLKCGRSTYVDKEEYHKHKTVSCPLPGCGWTWCKSCSWETEASDAESKQHSCDGAQELKKLMQSHGWKFCPGCRTPTERIDGCNHMTCPNAGCNTHFCYLCGMLIVQSIIYSDVDTAVSVHYDGCRRFGG